MQHACEQQDEEPADRARGQEHGQGVAGEQLDQKGAGHRRDGQADAQDAGDKAALRGRDLVRQHRHHRGEQRIEEQLREAPPQQDDRDRRRHRDDEQPQEPTQQSAYHPGAAHAEPPGRAVAQLAEERVGEQRQKGADSGHQRQAVRRLVAAHQRVDLQGQGDQQGCEQLQGRSQVSRREQRDEPPPGPALGGPPGLGDVGHRRVPFRLEASMCGRPATGGWPCSGDLAAWCARGGQLTTSITASM
nr:hypothetical protein [Modestobacter altitudinis]